MPDDHRDSTVPRRQLGRNLRELRDAAGLTVKEAATILEWSDTKIWRIEKGQTALRGFDVRAMCGVYRADERTTEGLVGLAKETKARGWWHAYGDIIPDYFDVYIGLEQAASEMFTYESELVPGLLQTEDYARILIREDNPGVDAAEIDRRVHVRIARQALITRRASPVTLHVILAEPVLRWPVGGPQVMAGQLGKLAEFSQLPNVSLQVVPFSAGFHRGLLAGPFVILRFPENGNGTASEPPTVYADGYTGALYLDKAHEVDRYQAAFDHLRSASLGEAESRQFIRQIGKELKS
jgi:transcriptional regulator with XRE-family HTH domain